jgi:hypothetical protein
MSGILDNKSRILDTIITKEGKRQIFDGKLKIEYATFSDSGINYDDSSDTTKRIYFEATSLPHDRVTLEADDSGRVTSFPSFDGIIKDGKILKYTFERDFVTGSSNNVEILSGTNFSSTSEKLLLSSTNAFRDLQTIGTKDYIFEDSGFEISDDSIRFYISNEKPLSSDNQDVSVNTLDDLSHDIRLSNLDNFKYLPPINKVDDKSIQRTYNNTKKFLLGSYVPWNYTDENKLTGLQLEEELATLEKIGYSKTLHFDPTSKDNNLLCQFFEKSNNELTKLDIIEFGVYQSEGFLKHAFFVGKIVVDDFGVEKFVHIFTLVFG